MKIRDTDWNVIKWLIDCNANKGLTLIAMLKMGENYGMKIRVTLIDWNVRNG